MNIPSDRLRRDDTPATAATGLPALEEGEVGLWLIRRPLQDSLSVALDRSGLDPAERQRAASFTRPCDGATYASAHIVLRRVLGEYLGLPVGEVTYIREMCPGCGGPHGRPVLSGSDRPLYFSLSHSHGAGLVGLSLVALGVDVQKVPPANIVRSCMSRLHPLEQAELEDVPEDLLPHAFGQLWARKEAYLKGLGTGLCRSPEKDYLGADPRYRPPGWTVFDVPYGPRHLAAVSFKGEMPARVTVRRPPKASTVQDAANPCSP